MPMATSHGDSMYLWCDTMRRTRDPYSFLAQTPKPCPVIKKAPTRSPVRHSPQNPWPGLLKTITIIESKESLKNCHSQEGPGRQDD